MPTLRGFYTRISKLSTWRHVAREVETFGSVLRQAEYLTALYGVKNVEAQPPELARAMLEVQRSLEELHEAVARARERIDYAATGSSSSPHTRSTLQPALNGTWSS